MVWLNNHTNSFSWLVKTTVAYAQMTQSGMINVDINDKNIEYLDIQLCS